MNDKRESERTELHRAIWNIANSLRGAVDGWEFKHYVLGMLFYRYISENLTNYINTSNSLTKKLLRLAQTLSELKAFLSYHLSYFVMFALKLLMTRT